ncbi:MAG: hypothetical protein PHF35_03040 [Candidatus Moranbacteria bacterium]|nr:hypothetical protein [Candidatus Moranbacteria bacterium]
MKKYTKIIQILIFFLLLVWLGFLLAEKINFATADLGRHIKNGEIIARDGLRLGEPNTVLNSNYYSYTYPDYPFANHHWAMGLVFYFIYKIAGFAGLSVFNILLALFAFSIMFFVAWRESNFTYATLFSFLLIPLMAERREIRPESLSAFFFAIFFLAPWLWSRKKISGRWLGFLPPLMFFWINLHIYFFLGFFVIGAFFLMEVGGIIFSRLSDSEFQDSLGKIKTLFFLGVVSAVAALANPLGFKGLFYPFRIYHEYGYTVMEEKSVWFLENYGIVNPNFILITGVLIFMAIGFAILFSIERKKSGFLCLVFGVFFGAIAWTSLRNFSLFGFTALPALSYILFRIFKKKGNQFDQAKEYGSGLLAIAVAVFAVFSNWQFAGAHAGNHGLGLAPGIEKSAQFFEEEGISGPIFNDYDIGGYLIFNLFPEERVFVDNRPETYPVEFFSDVYKPMQDHPEVFERVDGEYNFNSVFFYRHDITPWAKNFLASIAQNPDWTKVYEDDYAIIYLKNNEKNKAIIEKYKIN